VLGDGFRVEKGGSFVAGIDQSLPRRAFVQDDTPNSEKIYNAQLYVNLDGLNLAPGEQFEHFSARASGATLLDQFKLIITRGAAGPDILLAVRQDDGTLEETEPVSLSTGWNRVALSWTAASPATASLSVNQQPLRSLMGLNTAGGSIDLVQWGIVNATFTGNPGILLQDDFSSWR
jgi:hypothetical protein